ncbi:hypothetical protein EX30DRAFT_194212 [Ascodesmis nigricans]|uniref:Uncharacterized protein n=1 Tax=Ascodesmis nigricans TaxID=341454 RepID=A0A4S2MKT0_9PEZI|nr:hypothetical protein EX30DRAFT_194212 [Ascodesmis nigricans]
MRRESTRTTGQDTPRFSSSCVVVALPHFTVHQRARTTHTHTPPPAPHKPTTQQRWLVAPDPIQLLVHRCPSPLLLLHHHSPSSSFSSSSSLSSQTTPSPQSAFHPPPLSAHRCLSDPLLSPPPPTLLLHSDDNSLLSAPPAPPLRSRQSILCRSIAPIRRRPASL